MLRLTCGKLVTASAMFACSVVQLGSQTCTPAGDGPAGNAPYQLVYASAPQNNYTAYTANGSVGATQYGTCADCAGVVLLQSAYELQIIDSLSWNCSSTTYYGTGNSGYVSDLSGNGRNNFIWVSLNAYPSTAGNPVGSDNPYEDCYFEEQYPAFLTNQGC